MTTFNKTKFYLKISLTKITKIYKENLKNYYKIRDEKFNDLFY